MDNSKEYIKSLLEKYWAGESSLEEESQLSAYFTSGNVEDEFKSFIPLFSFFAGERNQAVRLEDNILNAIESRQASGTKPESKVIGIHWKQLFAIAASLLVVVTLGINTYRTQKLRQLQGVAQMDTFDSPEQALAQTKAALLFISGKMNKAADKATKTISKTKSLDIIN